MEKLKHIMVQKTKDNKQKKESGDLTKEEYWYLSELEDIALTIKEIQSKSIASYDRIMTDVLVWFSDKVRE